MKELDFVLIGEKIREIRIGKGITQETLANQVSVNVSHISNIENNRVKVSLTALVGICNALNTTVDYILSHEYKNSITALDNELLKEFQSCDNETKEKILKIIHILLS